MIFGVAHSLAAFFASFAAEFDARRADVAFVFGLSGRLYFLLGTGGGMLADRFGPRAATTAGNLLGPVAAGAVFDHGASCAPVMWGSLGLSGLGALPSARLLRLRGKAY